MTDMIDRAARVLFDADKLHWPDTDWEQLTDDDREPYRRMTKRMFDAAGVLHEERKHETTERDVEVDAIRAALDG